MTADDHVTDMVPNGQEISIIIVTYEVVDLVIACLKSIEVAGNGLNIKIYIVDNGSTDGTVETVRTRFPTVKVIALEKNVGFAAANNLALRQVTGTHLLLLNPDTILHPEAIRRLLAAARAYPLAIIGPRLCCADRSWQRSYYEFPSFADTVLRALGLPRVFHSARSAGGTDDPPTHVAVDWLSGACLFGTTEVFQRIGCFSEQYFMYMEDVEFCRRASDLGITRIYYPDAEVVHLGGTSAAKFAELHGTHPWLSEQDNNYVHYFRSTYGLVAGVCLALAQHVGLHTRPVFSAVRRALRGTA